jgi:retinol dehydrogenase 14
MFPYSLGRSNGYPLADSCTERCRVEEPLPEGAIRIVVITGGTSGIGRAVAESLVRRGGVHVVIVARSAQKAAETVKELCSDTGSVCASFVECDMASFASVRAAAEEICSRHPRVDVLVANAGTITAKRELTEDGHEMTFQVNHLSHFLLVNLLRSALTSAAPSRVVVVSSDAHFAAWSGMRFDDLDLEHGFRPFAAYAQSKLANILFAYEAAERWAGTGVSVNAVHPGNVRTQFARTSGWGSTFFGRLWRWFAPKLSLAEGASTVAWLAIAPEAEGASGLYFFRHRVKRSSPVSYDRNARLLLWNISARMTGLNGGGEFD